MRASAPKWLRRQLPLRWVIAGCYVALLALTLAALGGAIYWRVSDHVLRSGQTRLRYQIESKWNRQPSNRVTPGTAQLPALPGFPGWAPDLARELSTADVYVRVLLPDATVVASAGPTDVPRVDVARVQAMRPKFEARQRADGSYVQATALERWQVVQVPLVEGTRMIGVVQAGQSLRTADELLVALARYLFLGGLVALLAGAVAGMAVARLVAGPLETVAAAARRVAGGDLSARTGLSAPSETEERRLVTPETRAVAEAFDEMVARLEATIAGQRRFIADASHELKTPLTAIGGMAEMLQSGAYGGDPATRARALRTIEREVDRMSRLVQDLLTLSRTEQEPPKDVERLDVAEIVEDVAQHVRALHPAHHVRVQNGVAAWSVGDREQLTRALRNLTDNAAKHTPKGGEIRLICDVVDGWVEAAVSDNGAGIPAERLPHVFERFYRADQSRARKTGGFGLGLAIVQKIVEGHGGTVRIASKVGAGTTVTIRLPRAD